MMAREPACDLDQKLVAGSVSETVVDLLEVVEVEKHHGQAVAWGVVATKGKRELLPRSIGDWAAR